MTPTATYKDRGANGLCDSFAHNAALIPNAYTFQWMCVNGMEGLRRANNFRPKLYCFPDPSLLTPVTTNGMTPFSVYYTQIRMVPGTVVMGMTVNSTSNPFARQNNFYVEVVDDGTGVPFFTGWLSEVNFDAPTAFNDPNNTARPVYNGKIAWMPLTKTRVINSPGVISIGMCFKSDPNNASNFNIAPQVILVCAEPCSSQMVPGVCD